MPKECPAETLAPLSTVYFIHKAEIPADRWRDVTSGRIVCNVRP